MSKKILSEENIVQLGKAIVKSVPRPITVLPINGLRSRYGQPSDTGKDIESYGVYLYANDVTYPVKWAITSDAKQSEWGIDIEQYGTRDANGSLLPFEGAVYFCSEDGCYYTISHSSNREPVKAWRNVSVDEWIGTQAQYDALSDKKDDVTYYIVEE